MKIMTETVWFISYVKIHNVIIAYENLAEILTISNYTHSCCWPETDLSYLALTSQYPHTIIMYSAK